MHVIDLSGTQVGYWTVLTRSGSSPAGSALWLCQCKCGTEKVITGIVLRDKRSQSCGCLKRETTITRSTKHGHATNGITPTYHSWASLIGRCNNPKNKAYADYGGRGIKVCERWHDFQNFLADMGEKPLGKSIDRYPDNDGGYEPGNCRWATPNEQARNRRSATTLTFGGETLTLVEWAERTRINYGTLRSRLHRGYSVEQILAHA